MKSTPSGMKYTPSGMKSTPSGMKYTPSGMKSATGKWGLQLFGLSAKAV